VKKIAKFCKVPKSVTFLYTFPKLNWRGLLVGPRVLLGSLKEGDGGLADCPERRAYRGETWPSGARPSETLSQAPGMTSGCRRGQGAPLRPGGGRPAGAFLFLAFQLDNGTLAVGRRLQLPRRIYPRSDSAGRSCLSPTVYLPARSGRMTAYRRMNQKSGAALSAFSLFNTRRLPNTYSCSGR